MFVRSIWDPPLQSNDTRRIEKLYEYAYAFLRSVCISDGKAGCGFHGTAE